MKRLVKVFVGCSLFISITASAQTEVYQYGSGQDSIRCLENLSVYQNRYRNEERTGVFSPETIKAWRYAFFNCPLGSKNMYSPHGIKIFETLAKAAPDKQTRDAYIDTIRLIYDRRIEYFGEKEQYIGLKGADIFLLDQNLFEEAYALCKESVEALGNKSDIKTVIVLMQTAVAKVSRNTLEKSEAISLYQKLDEILAFKKQDNWRRNLESIFLRLNPSCDDLIAVFKTQFEANPNDVDLLKKITTHLAKDCSASELYFNAAVNLDKIEPSAHSKRSIAEMLLAKGSTSEAISYFQESVNLEEDENQKAETYFRMANVVIQNHRQSVTYANRALAHNPNMGRALLLIARQYVAGSDECGKDEEHPIIEKWRALWAAEDLCIRARTLDPSVTAQANADIARYRGNFPDVETMFAYNIIEGSAQTINCWFTATTQAKARK